MNVRSPDGRVDPNGSTLRALRDLIPSDVGVDILRGILIHHATPQIRVNRANAAKYAPHLNTYMPRYGIVTAIRKAHFLGQVALETNLLLWSEECASGAAYEGNEALGNTQPDDGVRFKGRGLLQLTGRTNYKAYGDSINVDMLKKPNEQTLAAKPAQAVRSACWFWKENNLNVPADADNGTAVSKIINGVRCRTLEERAYYTRRAKFFLK
jgi:putative chitinase